MTSQNNTSSVRLATAGFATLLVLLAIAAAGPVGEFLAVGLCVVMVVILVPVFIRGSWKDRGLAFLLLIFPAVLFVWILMHRRV